MDDPRAGWETVRAYVRGEAFARLGVDCMAVGLAVLDGPAVQIQDTPYLVGEIHEEPRTLQSHCASLLAIWSAARAPLVVDLGRCTCVGRRVLSGESSRGRRFAVHGRTIGQGRVVFAVISSTRRWGDEDGVKGVVDAVVERAVEAWPTIRAEPADALPESDADLDWYLFTGREIEILHLIAQGLSNKQIARQLGSSPNTVRNQIHAVFRKAGVSNRTELAMRVAATR